MEHFVVSARKYRPQSFKDVVGQQAITNTLLNAIENDHLAQALLFTGPRGVGKTTCARILAKKINQEDNQNPDEDFAFNIFELDAASNNSVDDIRNLIDQVRIPPQVGQYKVYIIDEVHMLSQAAFNAFLKTLEEPPKHAIFILATTEKHKIIPTILSRCQIFDFKRITVTDAKEYLAEIALREGINAEDDALHIIAQKADGAMRDALSIYDRVVSFSGKDLTRQAVTENLNVLDYDTYITITDLILKNNIPQLLIQYNEILSKGFDGHLFISGLASHFRDLLVCQNPQTVSLLEVGEQTKRLYLDQAKLASPEFLLGAIEMANTCDLQFKSSRNQRLLVELCLMQLASVTFNGEKKKPKSFIIPPAFFKETPKPVTPEIAGKVHQEINSQISPETPPHQEKAVANGSGYSHPSPADPKNLPAIDPVEKAQVFKPLDLNEKLEKKKISGLSIKSIQKKKELEAKKRENLEKEVIERDGEFSEKDMQSAWKEFAKQQSQKGEKILASIMESDIPVLQGHSICLELPNETMKLELERVQYPLMGYLKERLRNTHIELKITVNEQAGKKYAFTPMEKFQKLQEKNPLLEKLRITFDLDI